MKMRHATKYDRTTKKYFLPIPQSRHPPLHPRQKPASRTLRRGQRPIANRVCASAKVMATDEPGAARRRLTSEDSRPNAYRRDPKVYKRRTFSTPQIAKGMCNGLRSIEQFYRFNCQITPIFSRPISSMPPISRYCGGLTPRVGL